MRRHGLPAEPKDRLPLSLLRLRPRRRSAWTALPDGPRREPHGRPIRVFSLEKAKEIQDLDGATPMMNGLPAEPKDRLPLRLRRLSVKTALPDGRRREQHGKPHQESVAPGSVAAMMTQTRRQLPLLRLSRLPRLPLSYERINESLSKIFAVY